MISFDIPKNLFPYLIKEAQKMQLTPNRAAKQIVISKLHDEVYAEVSELVEQR
jgi:hypothetical protein